LGNGNGTFAAKMDYLTGRDPVSVSDWRLHADGKPDVATAGYSIDAVSVLLGNGDGSFSERTNYVTSNGPSAVVIGDLNADGMQDMTVANYNSNTVSVLLNIGQAPADVCPGSEFGIGRIVALKPNPVRTTTTIVFDSPVSER